MKLTRQQFEDYGRAIVILANDREQLKLAIQQKIEEIQKHELFRCKPALVEVNAPVALIQVGLKERYTALKEVLELIG